MSALARWFNSEGYRVAGYDKTVTKLTRSLEEEGMIIHYQDDVNYIEDEFKHKSTTLVIYTPAIPLAHTEYNYFLDQGFDMVKRSKVLGAITKKYFSVAVAGTHGKTTTSAMVAHLLKHAGKNCLGFIGGLTQNYQSNMLLDKGNNEAPIAVVEADEYDRSFLQLQPDIAIVTAVEPDHLDIYKTKEALSDTFKEFVQCIKPGGVLICHEDTSLQTLRNDIKNIVYGTKEGDIQANSIRVEGGSFTYDAVLPTRILYSLQLMLPGNHNVLNSLAAIGAVLELGIDDENIKEGVATFKGVKRRFEYLVKSDDVIYIDDYAHHPSEIKVVIEAVRTLYPNKKVTVIFQPHLFSRTRDFMDEFAGSLSAADEVLLLDIYPARELPIEGISSEKLLEKVTANQKSLLAKEGVIDYLNTHKPEVLLTVGAGDIDQLTEPIKAALVA